MKRPPLLLAAAAAGCAVFAPRQPCAAQTWRALSVSRPVASERLLRASIEFGLGTVMVMPAPTGTLYSVKLRYDPERYTPVQQYDPRTGILHLGVAAAASIGVRATSGPDASQTGRFEFSPDVPIDLRATLSASDATIDLGGMNLTALALDAAASHASVDFSHPTRGTCRSATFSVGAATLEVRHLADAGCAAIRVDGGAGSADLTFSGAWRRDASLVVDIAMGGLTLRLPPGLGVRVSGQRFLASLDTKGFTRSGNSWITPGYDQAAHKLDVELQASLGRIDIIWDVPR